MVYALLRQPMDYLIYLWKIDAQNVFRIQYRVQVFLA